MRLTLPALVTLAAVFVYFVTTLNVGRAREKYKIVAPAVTGNLDFERVYRVQMTWSMAGDWCSALSNQTSSN
jgi:hypothetical protein